MQLKSSLVIHTCSFGPGKMKKKIPCSQKNIFTKLLLLFLPYYPDQVCGLLTSQHAPHSKHLHYIIYNLFSTLFFLM